MPAVSMTVNGKQVTADADARTLLVQYLREGLRLTGTHVGCDTSQCGACVVHVDGKAVKSCTMFAWQAAGANVTTIEGLSGNGDGMHPLQEAFGEHHGLQSGYCTPGMLMAAASVLQDHPHPSEENIRRGLEGNVCRCTGYHNIVKAVRAAAGEEVGETSSRTATA